MSLPFIYLDNHATTPVAPEVVQTIQHYLEHGFANPSSIHFLGTQILKEVEEARTRIATSINAEPEEIIFTGSGSESNNLCIKGYCEANSSLHKHIITTSIEHPSVLNSCRALEAKGFEVTYLQVNKEGIVEAETLNQALRPDTLLVSIMHANHEIGTIQNLEELTRICQSRDVPLHTDAVQSYLKVPFDVKKLGVSLASFSGHKIHAPKGIGFIYKRKNIQLTRQIEGGNQEMRLRAGTENVPYIMGLAKAISLYTPETIHHMKTMQAYLIDQLKNIPGSRLNGPQDLTRRLCSNINVSFSGLEGEIILNALSGAGICISTGSACANRNTGFSATLKAIHCPIEYLHGNIRIGISRYTRREDLDTLLNQLHSIISNKKILQAWA